MASNAYKSVRILDDLIRLVARAFYDEHYVVILDALVSVKTYIKDEDLATMIKLHHKQVRSALSKLQQDQLVKSESRQVQDTKYTGTASDDVRHGRMHQHQFWFIDYRHFVDVVKYKLCVIQKSLSEEAAKDKEPSAYQCTKCKRKYSSLNFRYFSDKGIPLCENCKLELEETGIEEKPQNQTQKSSFQSQLKLIFEKLKQTEGIEIPYFNRDIITSITTQNGKAVVRSAHSGSSGKRNRDFESDTPQLLVDIIRNDDENPVLAYFGKRSKTAVIEESQSAKTKGPIPWLMTAEAKQAATLLEMELLEKKDE